MTDNLDDFTKALSTIVVSPIGVRYEYEDVVRRRKLLNTIGELQKDLERVEREELQLRRILTEILQQLDGAVVLDATKLTGDVQVIFTEYNNLSKEVKVWIE